MFQQHAANMPLILDRAGGRVRLDAIGWQVLAVSREQLHAVLEQASGTFVLPTGANLEHTLRTSFFMNIEQLITSSLHCLTIENTPEGFVFDPAAIAARHQLLTEIAAEIKKSRQQYPGLLALTTSV